MKTIAISLERRKDRRVRLEKHLKDNGLDDVLYFPAYDGAKMPVFQYSPPKRSYFSFKDEFANPCERFNKFQIGCTLSHAGAIKMAKALELKQVLIVEDDVEFIEPPNFHMILGNAPEDWDIIYLGGAVRSIAIGGKRIESIDVNDYIITPGFTDGLQAYIIRDTAYNKVANEMIKFDTTNDDCINDLRYYEDEPLKAYMLKTKIAYQIEDWSELDRRIIKRNWT